MQDTEPLESRMDGKQYTASHLAATLRRMLWREHLGLLPAQSLDGSDDPNAQPPNDSPNFWHEGDEYDELVADPLGDKVWDLWTKQADTNTQVFRDLFHADPDDSIRNFDDYEKFLPKESGKKQGHLFDPSQPVDEIRKQLDKIRVRPFRLPDLPFRFWLLTFSSFRATWSGSRYVSWRMRVRCRSEGWLSMSIQRVSTPDSLLYNYHNIIL